MRWRIPVQTLFDQDVTSGNSHDSSVFGSLDRNVYYPLTSPAGVMVPASNVLTLQAVGTPARFVYVRVTQANNDVQQVTINQTGA